MKSLKGNGPFPMNECTNAGKTGPMPNVLTQVNQDHVHGSLATPRALRNFSLFLRLSFISVIDVIVDFALQLDQAVEYESCHHFQIYIYTASTGRSATCFCLN